MPRALLTTPTFQQIISARKAIAAHRVRAQSKPGHIGINVELSCPDIAGRLSVVIRMTVALIESFSIVLRYERDHFPCVAILRVNGDHGQHRNPDGTIVTGPHVHAPVPSEMNSIPTKDFEPRFAEAVAARYVQLPFAWALFRERVALEPHEQMADRIRRMHTTYSQETFDDLFRDS